MKFVARVVISVAVVLVCFAIYSPLGIFYIIGLAIFLAASSFLPSDHDDDKSNRSLFPSTHVATDISSAWLGAKMDEEEARRKQGEKESRDQGH